MYVLFSMSLYNCGIWTWNFYMEQQFTAKVLFNVLVTV